MEENYTPISNLPSDTTMGPNSKMGNIPPTVSISNMKGNKLDGDIPTTYIPINVHQNPYGISNQNPIMEHGQNTFNGQNNEITYSLNNQPHIPEMYREQIQNMKPQKLPSRDIPQNPTTYSNDEQIQANYIPIPKNNNDYITEQDNITNRDIEEYNRKKRRTNTIDKILNEIQMPIFITLLFLLFQLPIVNNTFFKPFTIFSLMNLDGNYNLYGLVLKSIIFGCVYYITINFITFISEI